MKIAIMTDSTAALPEELIQKYGIFVIPLNVIFGHDSYEEGINLSTKQFIEKLEKDKDLPKTSQPSIGNFIELFEEIKKSYDAVITIHISSGISGTYQTAMTASKMVDGLEVYPFDSGISSVIQGYYVIEAAKMVRKNKNVEEILIRLEEIRTTHDAYFMVDDLQHLQRGGRLSKGSALVGSLLRVKPLLHFEDRKIVPFEKIRTRKRAIRRILEILEKQNEKREVCQIAVIHSEQEEIVENIYEKLKRKYPQAKITISGFTPVLLTHLGIGALGIGWYS